MISKVKKITIVSLLSLIVLWGCKNDQPSNSNQTSLWYEQYTEDELKAFYKQPIKIGYTENFTFTNTSFEVGYGNNKTTVYPFEEIIRSKFPNATFHKIADESDTVSIINKEYDVLYGLNTYSLEKLKAEYYLETFTPEWANEVQDGLNDSKGTYFAIGKEAVVSLYNYRYFEQDVSFDNLTTLCEDENYKNRYALNYIKSGWSNVVNKTILTSILYPYRSDEEGAISGISIEGWNKLENWITSMKSEDISGSTILNDSNFKNDESEIKIVLDNATDAMDKLTYYRNNPKKIKARIERVPQNEMPYFIYGVAITRSTKYLETSKLFMDYVGRQDVEEEMSRNKRSFFPANDKVLTKEMAYRLDSDQAGLDYKNGYETRQLLYRLKSIKAMTIDWEFVNKHIDEWLLKVKKLG